MAFLASFLAAFLAAFLLFSCCDPFAVARPYSCVDFSASSSAFVNSWLACGPYYRPCLLLLTFFADVITFEVDLD